MADPTGKKCAGCGKMHTRRRGPNSKYFASECGDCHAAYWRIHRPKHFELSEEARYKANARSYANSEKRRGNLVPQPCGKCGSDDSQMHHEDYDQALVVQWVCVRCHVEIHRHV